MVQLLIVKKIIDDESMKNLEGTWIDESFIKYPLINNDTDVYYEEDNKKILLCKFRKKVISNELIDIGWKNYKDLAKASRGRGASAGPINKESQYWKKRNLVDTKKWSTSYINKNGKKSKMKVNNQVASNPIGFYESSKNFANLPCRLTHFTRTNFDKYNNGLPFIERINSLFKELIPDSYQSQLDRAMKKENFRIKNTAFSTITINRNFRTALHMDAGDFKGGFGNLTVIERGKYHGGYTVFPQFGIGINVRCGDFLAMDVHKYHANTEIYETDEDKEYNLTIPKDYNDNPDVGTKGIYTNYTRLSFVCYLREKLINCDEVNIDSRFLTKSGHSKIDNDNYTCIYNCGFNGSYSEVETHEKICKKNIDNNK